MWGGVGAVRGGPGEGSNWSVDFLTGHSNCTVYNGQVSTLKSITASIIQGSGIGPAAYVVNVGDLHAVTPGNQLCKFADDVFNHTSQQCRLTIR